nr:outer membrane protein [Helicobacter cetorum]
MKITTTKFNKENSVKHFKNNIKFLAPLSLVLSLSLSPLSAEEDGGFMTFGYELGQVVQSVKNPNKYQAMEVAKELNSAVTVHLDGGYTQVDLKGNGDYQTIPQQGLNIVGLLGNTLMTTLIKVAVLSPATLLPNSNGSPLFNAYQGISKALGGINYPSNSGGPNPSQQEMEHNFGNFVCSGITTMGPSPLCKKDGKEVGGLVEQLTQAGIVQSYFQYMVYWMQKNPDAYQKAGITMGSGEGYNHQNNTTVVEALSKEFGGIYGKDGQVTMQSMVEGAYVGAINAIEGITKAALQLNNFNAANASGTLSTAEFTGLVDGIISTSSQALKNLEIASINNGKEGFNPSYAQGKGTGRLNGGSLGQMKALITNTQNTLNAVVQANDNLKAHPWLGQFAAGNSKQTNAMSGFYTKIGYKQFFGKKKAFGLRYYGFFSYNGAGVGNGANYNTVNLLTYGVGTDALYNVFSRSFGSRSIDAGFFTGIQLAGDSYITSLAKSVQVDTKKVTATKFQFLFDVGMRMNFGILKKI